MNSFEGNYKNPMNDSTQVVPKRKYDFSPQVIIVILALVLLLLGGVAVLAISVLPTFERPANKHSSITMSAAGTQLGQKVNNGYGGNSSAINPNSLGSGQYSVTDDTTVGIEFRSGAVGTQCESSWHAGNKSKSNVQMQYHLFVNNTEVAVSPVLKQGQYTSNLTLKSPLEAGTYKALNVEYYYNGASNSETPIGSQVYHVTVTVDDK